MRVASAKSSAPFVPDFAAWVTPHLVAMTRLALRLAPAGEHEDVVQLSLERAWRRRATFNPSRGSAQSWLLAIVADQARRLRSRRRSHDVEMPNGFVEPADPTLELAVRQLPRRQRMAVELHYYLGLPVKECAEVLGVAEGTVKSALSDARANLRSLLEVDDD
jgi:DNA-directed RNA polymerase specialized sigma24 family protein